MHYPANIRLDEDVLKTSFVFIFKRRLQDVLMKTNIFLLVIRLQKTSSRRLQHVLLKTNIFILSIRLQDVFKTSSRYLQDVFAKTSSRRLANTPWRYLQDVLKTYHQVKLLLLISLWEVFNTFVKRTAKTVAYRRNTSEKFMVCVEKFSRVIKISQVLVFHFPTPFSACL